MNSDKIFFSYSRDDSEFVLGLTTKLRERGAHIWLDQLDIAPGTRWDKSVETALEESEVLLVALSKASVASYNVMDEVSFALEKGKQVIPVLLEDCKIPFRLRRLQFADFSNNYDEGLSRLLKVLNLHDTKTTVATEPSEVLVEPPSDQHNISEENKEIPVPTTQIKNEVPEKTSDKWMIYIGGAVLAGALLWLIMWIIPDKEPALQETLAADTEDWELILEGGSNQAVENHLQRFDSCIHKKEANLLLTSIKESESAATGQAADSIENNEMPVNKVVKNEVVNTIDPEWVKVKSSKSVGQLSNYLLTIQNKEGHLLDAKGAIEALLNKTGYIVYNRPGYGYSHFDKLVATSSNGVEIKNIAPSFPSQGDLLVANGNIRGTVLMYLNFAPSFDNIYFNSSAGPIVKFVEEYKGPHPPTGDDVWIKVLYGTK